MIRGAILPKSWKRTDGIGLNHCSFFLGIWEGERENRSGYWLRWWDKQDNLLLWGSELAQQEAQRAQQEAQRAQQEAQRAERLRAQLRAVGIEPGD